MWWGVVRGEVDVACGEVGRGIGEVGCGMWRGGGAAYNILEIAIGTNITTLTINKQRK